MACFAGRIPARVRPSVVGLRGGGLYVSERQRTRLLDATFALVAERGYAGVTVRKVCERAGISSKTFYDLFCDREDCFLAAFDYALKELAAVALPAYEAENEWAARVRAALGALLAMLDGEPALRRLVFVEALAAGPRVLVRRASVLEELAGVIDGGREGVKAAAELSPLTAEGVVGATFGVLYARLLQDEPDSLMGLLAGFMATIVLPYRGRAAAGLELARPAPRLTNHAVHEIGGLQDLVENDGGHGQGAPKAWSLTRVGEEIVRANPPLQNTHAAGRTPDLPRAMR